MVKKDRDGRNTKAYQLRSFSVAIFGPKDKPIRNWGRCSRESYAIFEDKSSIHIEDMNEHYYN